MRMYRIDQTTGKSQPGGESGGLFSDAKLSMLPMLISADNAPTPSGIAIFIISFLKFVFKKSPPYCLRYSNGGDCIHFLVPDNDFYSVISARHKIPKA